MPATNTREGLMLTGTEVVRLKTLARAMAGKTLKDRQVYNYTQKMIVTLNRAERREKRKVKGND